MGVIDGCGVGWWVDGVAVSVAAAAAAAAVGLCLVALGGPALPFVAVRTAHPTRSARYVVKATAPACTRASRRTRGTGREFSLRQDSKP